MRPTRSLRNALHFFYAWWGAVRYRHPSKKLLVIGITGTSGKSSTIYLLRQILEAADFKVGALSTIEFCVAGKCQLNDKKMTMLGRTRIQKYLSEMVRAGCAIALIETTSEGFLQHRQRFINYDTIVLTNLYPEHLEAHGGFANYKAAKLGIFQYVAGQKRKTLAGKPIPKTAIVNGASEYAAEFLSFPFDKKICFDPNEFVQKNRAATAATARSLGVADALIQKTLTSVSSIPGRIERLSEAQRLGFEVIVDYAFEPVAMAALYEVVGELKPNRVIHVFGSTGGGRDKARRFTVGKFVGERADICIVTDEDPYDDDPLEIINDVAQAVRQTGPPRRSEAEAGLPRRRAGKRDPETLLIIPERGAAIKKAIDLAQTGDVVLITGKGSEQAMVVRGTLVPWDDREMARKILKKRETRN